MVSSEGPNVSFRYLTAAAPRPIALVLLLTTLGAVLWLMIGRAWVGEDAFITFRTVDQFVHGGGLRWNPDERVQVYTHPLWMLASIPLYALVRDSVTVAVTLGLVCSAASFLTIGSRFCRRPFVLLVGLVLPLVCSETVLLYGTSGFENAMSNLGYAAFAVLFLRGLDRGEIAWGGLALASSLAVTNRLDTVFVYIPPIAILMLRHFATIRWRPFLAGYLPIVAWLAFATFYYGFPYPNTALAKINEEISRSVVMHQGLYYLLDLLSRDPAAFFMLGLGTVVTVGHLVSGLIGRDRERSFALASLGVGALCYIYYVVWVGGSFLSGRHFMLPLFVFIVLWAELLHAWAKRVGGLIETGGLAAKLESAVVAPVLSFAVVLGAALYTIDRGPDLKPSDLAWAISDPRDPMDHYRRIAPISTPRYWLDTAHWQWKKTALAQRLWTRGKQIAKEPIGSTVAIGLTGIAAGRDSIIIDRYALSDPLLARLPPGKFKIMGHFGREVPRGYLHARLTQRLDQMNPHLREYYRPLRTIISGPLFSWSRILEIYRFNTGRYDHHLAKYLEGRPHTSASLGSG